MKVLVISGGHEILVVDNEEQGRKAKETTVFDRTVFVDALESGSNVVAFPSGASNVSLNTGLNDQVEALEEKLVNEAMTKTGNNQVKAARLLRISRGALQHKLKKYSKKITEQAA